MMFTHMMMMAYVSSPVALAMAAGQSMISIAMYLMNIPFVFKMIFFRAI